MNNIKHTKWLLSIATLAMGMGLASCEDEPDKFEMTDGIPVVKYVRTTNPEKGDSLLTGAYLDNIICLVGDNLTSIHELYFNDQPAILNTSFITDHTLIVSVPGGIPEVVTNKIYMITKSNQTVEYDFNVLVPAPAVRTMSCEWAKAGTEATIYGDYLLDDPNIPLTVTMPGNIQAEVTSVSKTAVKFIVPEGADQGYINVTTLYGTTRSQFQFHDKRNILFDWDGTRGGHTTAHGWRNGVIHESGTEVEGIDGAYLYFGGADMLGEIGGTWAEDQFCFNYWPDEANGYEKLGSRPEFAEMIDAYGVENLQVKFELYVPTSHPWKSAALQIMFTPSSIVDYNSGTNAYYSDTSMARGLWNPWQATGSYDTADEWVTVSLPVSTFTYNHEGSAATGSPFDATFFDGLTFFVWHGGVAGTDCSPELYIDNIRVVPIE